MQGTWDWSWTWWEFNRAWWVFGDGPKIVENALKCISNKIDFEKSNRSPFSGSNKYHSNFSVDSDSKRINNIHEPNSQPYSYEIQWMSIPSPKRSKVRFCVSWSAGSENLTLGTYRTYFCNWTTSSIFRGCDRKCSCYGRIHRKRWTYISCQHWIPCEVCFSFSRH